MSFLKAIHDSLDQGKSIVMATYFVLSLVFVGLASSAHINDNVECGPVDTACECDAGADVCTFQFYVENVCIPSSTSTTSAFSHGQYRSTVTIDTVDVALGESLDFVQDSQSAQQGCNHEVFI